jgi:hypothetical protein
LRSPEAGSALAHAGEAFFNLLRQAGGQKLAEFGMRFDQPHDIQQVLLAFAGAAFGVLHCPWRLAHFSTKASNPL